MNAFENVTITDTTANGYVELFKRTDRKGTFLPEPGAVFQIYLASAGSYENANSSERDEITTNADGYARSQLLPIGEYCIRQISAPVGTRILEETRTVNLGTDDKGTPIQNDAERVEVINSVTEGQIAITKTADNLYAEPGATFAVYLSSAGSYEAADFREKDTITTDYRGIATSKPLPYGIYTVHQTDAPPGTIAIADYEITVGAVDGAVQNRTVNNLAQNCRLVIEKVGEVLTSAEVTETQYKDGEGNSLSGYSFQYSSEGIAGASFALFVGEQDILDYAGEPKRIDCDGDGIRETELSAGTKIGVIEALPVKDADGSLHYRAEYSGLPLDAAGGAQYIAREIAAPYGQILSDEPLVFDFTYADQSIGIISQDKTLQNKRQIPEIYLDKQRETSEWNPATDEFDVNIIPAEGVLFGIYTAWEIKDSKGNVLVPAGAPVDYLITDALGHAKGGRELPPGVYCVRELRAAEGSVFDDKKTYTIAFTPQEENSGDLVSIPVNEGVPILNREIRGVLSIEKIAEDTGLPLAGVHFAVYDMRGNEVDAFITNEDGEAMTRPLPYGEYTLAETKTKEGYALMENKEFNIYVSPGPEEDYSVIPMQLANQKLAAIEVFKITEDGQAPMSQVVFEICDKNSGEEIQRVTTDQNGYARAFVQPGSYLLRELSTWEGYCISEEPIVIENAEYQGIYTYRLANRRSQLVVYKESTDGLKLADMEFKVVDKDSKEVVRLAYSQDTKEYIAIPAGIDARDPLMTGLTDSEGRAIIRGLPSGSYDVIEVKAPNGYILDEGPIQIKMNTNETDITPEVTLIDKRTPIKTGEQTSNSMMIGGSVLCALGLVLLLWIRKRIGKQA